MNGEKQQLNHFYFSLFRKLSEKNSRCALATVTSVVGSAPQIPGSSAVFGRNRLLAGTVGGGATELAVTKIVARLFRTKKPGYFSFDLNHRIGDGKGPICGGGMNILIDANPEIHLPVFKSVTESLMNRKPGILLTIFTQNEKESFISREWVTTQNQENNSLKTTSAIQKQVAEMLSNPVAGDFREIQLSKPGNQEMEIAFLEAVFPPPQLIIAGAGHVGKALMHIGSLLGFEVIAWDDRPEYITTKNLPDAHQIFSGELTQMKKMLQLSKDTYVVIVTHGHAKDIEVLKAFISENVRYIGMMGSKRKILLVRQMFIENGWATDEQWNRVHTPIGLEIGSKTVNEIAVSIAAQLIQEKNRK